MSNTIDNDFLTTTKNILKNFIDYNTSKLQKYFDIYYKNINNLYFKDYSQYDENVKNILEFTVLESKSIVLNQTVKYINNFLQFLNKRYVIILEDSRNEPNNVYYKFSKNMYLFFDDMLSANMLERIKSLKNNYDSFILDEYIQFDKYIARQMDDYANINFDDGFIEANKREFKSLFDAGCTKLYLAFAAIKNIMENNNEDIMLHVHCCRVAIDLMVIFYAVLNSIEIITKEEK